MDIQHWVNEGLMAIFFLVVGLEIKRELVDGELRGWRRASFPVVAAIGGMLVPALIYSLFNPTLPESQGWAIPMATDIAIAVGVLGILGKRIPRILRIFLLTLAIVDDIGSIIVIGVFYNQPTSTLALLLAVITVLALAIFRKQKTWPVAFVVLGFLLWYFLLLSGVSATIAGIILAFLAPLVTRRKSSRHLQMSELAEDLLIPLASIVIVPLFVLVNAGVDLSSISLGSSTEMRIFLGIVLGLCIGKPIGIIAAVVIGKYIGITKIPPGIRLAHVLGAGMIAGIGFTMSMLISDLAFSTVPNLKNAAIIAIFCGSMISALGGILILGRSTPKLTAGSKHP